MSAHPDGNGHQAGGASCGLGAFDAALNHVELVYRPGERALARRVFELLGATVQDFGGPFLTVVLGAGQDDLVSNVLYASEVLPEQWKFEQRLADQLAAGGPLHTEASPFFERLAVQPQSSSHFGLRVGGADAFDAALERVRQAGASDPELAGRVEVAAVYRPGDEGSLTDLMVQAFVRTDVVASGLLALGQFIELQLHTPRPPAV